MAERYPDAITEATDSTALAAEMASHEPTSLAVASLMCAEVYDLDVIDTEIQDGEGELDHGQTAAWDKRTKKYFHSKSYNFHSLQKGKLDNGKYLP